MDNIHTAQMVIRIYSGRLIGGLITTSCAGTNDSVVVL